MQGRIFAGRHVWATLALVCLTVPSTGCMGLAAQLLYFARGGDRVPAEFKGLDRSKVAVVCVGSDSAVGPEDTTGQLASIVEQKLRTNAKRVTFIPQSQVTKWIDQNNWDQVDFREIGRGLEAEKVLAINISGFSLHDNGTAFFKGRANVSLSVYDMKDNGREVWRKSLSQMQFPQNGVHHSTDLTDAAFRQLFLADIGEQISKRFYSYEVQEDMARDAALMGGR